MRWLCGLLSNYFDHLFYWLLLEVYHSTVFDWMHYENRSCWQFVLPLLVSILWVWSHEHCHSRTPTHCHATISHSHKLLKWINVTWVNEWPSYWCHGSRAATTNYGISVSKCFRQIWYDVFSTSSSQYSAQVKGWQVTGVVSCHVKLWYGRMCHVALSDYLTSCQNLHALH